MRYNKKCETSSVLAQENRRLRNEKRELISSRASVVDDKDVIGQLVMKLSSTEHEKEKVEKENKVLKTDVANSKIEIEQIELKAVNKVKAILEERGQPDIVHNMIGPTIDGVLGLEARSRSDLMVSARFYNVCVITSR